jgi:hypothetical protein
MLDRLTTRRTPEHAIALAMAVPNRACERRMSGASYAGGIITYTAVAPSNAGAGNPGS